MWLSVFLGKWSINSCTPISRQLHALIFQCFTCFHYLFLFLFKVISLIKWIDSIIPIARNQPLNHLLYENESTQSSIKSLRKRSSINSISFGGKWTDSRETTQTSWLVYKPVPKNVFSGKILECASDHPIYFVFFGENQSFFAITWQSKRI